MNQVHCSPPFFIGKTVGFGNLNKGKIDALYPDYEFTWKGKDIKVTEQTVSTTSEIQLQNKASKMKPSDFIPPPESAKIKQPASKKICQSLTPKYSSLHVSTPTIFIDPESQNYEIDYFL